MTKYVSNDFVIVRFIFFFLHVFNKNSCVGKFLHDIDSFPLLKWDFAHLFMCLLSNNLFEIGVLSVSCLNERWVKTKRQLKASFSVGMGQMFCNQTQYFISIKLTWITTLFPHQTTTPDKRQMGKFLGTFFVFEITDTLLYPFESPRWGQLGWVCTIYSDMENKKKNAWFIPF